MKYIKTINDCNGCHHSDHSGSFTPGGAQPVCRHPETVDSKGPDWKNRVIPHNMVKGWHSTQSSYQLIEIPSWCPLRKTEIK